jgi:hypothetical protein
MGPDAPIGLLHNAVVSRREAISRTPRSQLTTFVALPSMNATRLAAATARRRWRAEFIATKKAAGRLQDLAAAEGPNQIRWERIGKAVD